MPGYIKDVEQSLEAGIILLNNSTLQFKHELYRRTIEASVSPLKRININKQLLDLLLEDFNSNAQTQRIIHHAKNANENDVIVQYAPLGARQSATAGAHIEAAKLYLTAIEHYKGNDANVLIPLYEGYAYECYLTNQINEAIAYTKRALTLWTAKGDAERTGNSLRFLSRISWFNGNRKSAEQYGLQAIEVLDSQPSCKAKAMAYSNMSQLKMLSSEAAECIYWGEKAIAIGKELKDNEVLAHAYNNVGTQIALTDGQKGLQLLGESLDIAVKNGYQEHAARAYTNMGDSYLVTKDYANAKRCLDEGIKYCDERDLGSWSSYMLGCKARLLLETGHWDEAISIANNLMANGRQSPVIKTGALTVVTTVEMRRGKNISPAELLEARNIAFETTEIQRLVVALTPLLEYEWLTGKTVVKDSDIETVVELMPQKGNLYQNSQLAFWVYKARRKKLGLPKVYEGYDIDTAGKAIAAAALWQKKENYYHQALCLFEGDDEEKKKAIVLMQATGAVAAVERMKGDMRAAGIKSIPRGVRKTTQANAAQLTARELDILQQLHKGLQNKEIAAALFISPKTVDHHISNILFKLDATTRAKAVQEAIKLGIIVHGR